MRTTTKTWRPVPLALGVFFTVITGRVLFDDVIASPLPLWQAINTSHALSLAGLVAALAAGHYVVAEWKARRFGTALALTVLFLAATGYVAVSSGMRNAEVADAKARTATDLADKRVAAKARLDASTTAHQAAVSYWTTQRDAAAAECKSGEGTKCKGARSTAASAHDVAELRRGEVDRLQTAFDALKPAPVANAGYAHVAKVFAAIYGDAKAIEARLVLTMPFVIVLVTELATIVFLHKGLPLAATDMPVARRPVAALTTAHSFPNPDTLSPAEIEDARRLLVSPTNSNVVEHPVLAAIRQAGRPLSNDELAHAMCVTKGEASKRRREVSHLVTERRDGRHIRVSM